MTTKKTINNIVKRLAELQHDAEALAQKWSGHSTEMEAMNKGKAFAYAVARAIVSNRTGADL